MLTLHLPNSHTEAISMCTANSHLCCSGEKNEQQMRKKGEQRQNHDASFGTTVVSEKARLGMKRG